MWKKKEKKIIGKTKRLLLRFGKFPIILLAIFLVMLTWSWRKWPDFLIDFGRELYIPWQLSSGKMLYRDIAHIFGPLSSYFNTLQFKIFGVSYLVIIISNTVLLAFFLFILYTLLKKVTSHLTAFISCLAVITLFAFSQYKYIGNYNFISPYAHEATHGLILSLLMIYSFHLLIIKKSNCFIALSGFLFGLIYLTKPEIFISASATASLFFILYWKNNKQLLFTLKLIILFTGFALFPLILFIVYFWTGMAFHDAVKTILIPYRFSFNSNIISNSFYITGMGFDDIEKNIFRMLIETATALLITFSVLYLSRFYPDKKKKQKMKFLCLLGFTICIGIIFYVNPHKTRHSLPILDLFSFIILLSTYLKLHKKNISETNRLIPLLLWSVFSFFLLIKTILYCKLFQYGFYTSLPTVVLIIIMVIWFIPEYEVKTSTENEFSLM